MSMIQELRVEIDELQIRLAAPRMVYDRYRDMDAGIMSPLFLIGDGHCNAAHRRTIRDLWEAIKTAVEGKHDSTA